MFALVVRFQVRPERVVDFDRLVEQTIARIDEEEPGTLTYLATTVDDDAHARVFIEIYEDESAFAVHEEQPHTQHFLREREPLLASVRVERLTVLDV
jgi:quinol monooxygenase YgiN